MRLIRKPTPGRYGTEIFTVRAGPYGGTNLLGGATLVTANQTNTYKLGGLPAKARFLKVSVTQGTLGADSDGALTFQVGKLQNDGSTFVQLSADINLETATANVPTRAGVYASATEGNLVVKTDEQLVFRIINDSAAINTQPAELNVTLEFALLE